MDASADGAIIGVGACQAAGQTTTRRGEQMPERLTDERAMQLLDLLADYAADCADQASPIGKHLSVRELVDDLVGSISSPLPDQWGGELRRRLEL